MDQPPALLDVTEGARRIGVSPETLAKWCREGVVRAARLPGDRGAFRIAPADLFRALRPAAESRAAGSGPERR